ncbi:MAG: glycosyltransferase family 4 protein [Fusobacteriaceae bacterium]
MNILYSVFADGWGGLEKYPLTLFEILRNKGHYVAIFTKKGTKLYEESLKLGIDTFNVDSFKKIDFKIIREMRGVLIEKNIDVVHINTSRELYNWRLALIGLPHIKLVMTFHIGIPNHNELLHNFLYKRVDSIIAISKFEMMQMYDKLPVPHNKINLLYNGVNLDKFKQNISDNCNNESINTIKEKFNIPKNHLLFTSIGNLSAGKGILEWVKATIKVCNTREDVSFIWIGDDSHVTENYTMKDLKKEISDANLNHRIILAGYQTNVPDFLKESDVFLLPARNESFGLVYIEAMAMGLPVIGCNSGGAKEIITDGVQGYLCEPDDVTSLVETINKAANNIDTLREIGKNNIENVKNYSMELHIERLLDIYKK